MPSLLLLLVLLLLHPSSSPPPCVRAADSTRLIERMTKYIQAAESNNTPPAPQRTIVFVVEDRCLNTPPDDDTCLRLVFGQCHTLSTFACLMNQLTVNSECAKLKALPVAGVSTNEWWQAWIPGLVSELTRLGWKASASSTLSPDVLAAADVIVLQTAGRLQAMAELLDLNSAAPSGDTPRRRIGIVLVDPFPSNTLQVLSGV